MPGLCSAFYDSSPSPHALILPPHGLCELETFWFITRYDNSQATAKTLLKFSKF